MSVATARNLRRKMTDAERKLWHALRDRRLAGHKFRRQHPIGPYVADFYCEAKRLMVEVDGGQHTRRQQADAKRTKWLEARGYRVIRLWNSEVLTNLEGVQKVILEALEQPDR